MKDTTMNPQYFTFSFYKDKKISISKPLIILKLTLFLYYGAGSFVTSFLIVLYKQNGMSLSELSTMTIVAPVFQFTGSALSGIIADKIGKAKPVFIVQVLLSSSTLFAITLLPSLNIVTTKFQNIDIICHKNRIGEVIVLASCKAVADSVEIQSCHGYCPNEFIQQCSTRNIDCWNSINTQEFNSSHIMRINNTFFERVNDSFQYNVLPSTSENQYNSWCSKRQNQYCITSCIVLSKEKQRKDGISGLLVVYAWLFVQFLATFSSAYRCLDVTVMFLVIKYNSNFGHERFFAIMGIVLLSPLAGLVVSATTPINSDRNCSSALYLYIALCATMLIIVYNLPMVVKTPGENMWQKSVLLFKNPDIISFFIVISILGSSWNLSKYFLVWYLEGINASSMLIGLLTSVSALYGLPFLLTSHWWLKKIGATHIFILALVSYSISFTGYSFIQDPWISLVLESNGILTYYLLWVAVIEYSHDIAPEGLTATVIAMAGTTHYNLGKITAGLTGRFIMEHYGGRIAFRFCAVMTLSVAVLYALFLCVRKYIKARHESDAALHTSP